ncbi:MAG: 50S ribosomal protein L4 [Clostridiaceae bacterium]|nr:50S ribosomal protein L4 [Clostridiales bacterium]MDD6876602.1 50S ribosomal protein L4 [Clostridiaceae bacterium]MDY3070997.1 50S ribosomal protein L4 [Eubacteriales bacterium]MDY3286137.1 50S ribosomal protein L4 [Eubacteriales bacterium]MDY5015669.1 50S ribosomal protein L4 [Eubacteriales bacterium]
MPKAQLYNMAGEKLGEMELPSSVFGIEPNGVAMHAAVKQHLANLRQGTQSTLTRAEVSGGGRKPWRQKGTGRARQGSTRAPQWTHGGVVFAPKPRDYSFSLNRKYKRLALLSALSDKAASGDVIVIDRLDCAEIKTKPFAKFLAAVGADKKAYVVTPETRRNVVLSARNIPGVRTQLANLVNTYDILDSGKLVIDRDAVSKLEEVFGK